MKAKGWQRRDLRRSHTHSNSLFSKTRKKEISLQERGGRRFKDEEEEAGCILYRARNLDYKYVQRL